MLKTTTFLLFFISFSTIAQSEKFLDITWISPLPINFDDGVVKTETADIKLTFNLRSAFSEDEIKSHLKILLNGKDINENQKTIGKISTKKKESECIVSRDLILEDGRNRIEMILTLPNQPILKSKVLEIDYLSKEKPNLHVLCIGVKTNLKYSKNDAEDLYNAFKKQEGFLFNLVRGEILICKDETDKKTIATRILQLKNQDLKPKDVLIILLSGHGINSVENEADDFYLLTSDVDEIDATNRYTLLSYQKDVIDNIKDISCKRIILIDACHSGAAESYVSSRRDVTNFSKIQEAIARTPPSIITLTSSRGNEVSYEDAQWQNGAFTESIIEGLNGKADSNRDNAISINELVNYTIRRVPILTAFKSIPQHPKLIEDIQYDFTIYEYLHFDKSYKPLVKDCIPPPEPATSKSNFITIITLSEDEKGVDFSLNDKVEQKIKYFNPVLNIGKLQDESLIRSGIIKSLKSGNAAAIGQIKEDLGKGLFIISKKTVFGLRPATGQVIIHEAKTYITFTQIDPKTGKILKVFEADDVPTIKSDTNRQKAEQMALKLTLDQLNPDYFK